MDTKHSFLKGLNRDISKDKFPSDAYYYLLNGRILTDDDATLSDIINLKSNTDANIDDDSLIRDLFSIIGYTTIENDIILFYADNNATGADSPSTQSIIDVLEYQGNNQYLRIEKWKAAGLNFRIDKKIRAVARYEADDIKKIYWTDDNENIRHANIGEDISALEPEEFDFLGDFYDTPRIHLESYTSGNIKQGIIQYAYRFVKLNGYKTVFSQISNPIPIGRNINYTLPLNKTKGDPIYDEDNQYNTGRGTRLRLSVNVLDYIDFYDYIEVVSLWHSSKESVPDITIINRLDLETGKTVYNFIDEGSSNYGTLEYSQLLEQQNDFTVKDLVAKDNRLFVGNINERSFDLDTELGSYWDARAYRFTLDAGSNTAYLWNAGYGSTHNTIVGPAPLDSAYEAVAETADCLTKYNRITATIADEQDTGSTVCKFQANGTTEGGSGLNLEYYFYEDTYYTSSLVAATPDIAGTIENDYQLGNRKGFQRGEVYRFGIVFFDKKGRQSFVKWIGDIRFPSLETSSATTFTVGTGKIDANHLLIGFDLLNVPSLEGQVLDWQIVYVKREEEDRNVVFAGMINGSRYEELTVNNTRPNLYLYDVGTYTTEAGGGGGPDTINPYVISIMSPDVVFQKTQYLNADYVELIGRLEMYKGLHKDLNDPYTTWVDNTATFQTYTDTNIHVYVKTFPTLKSYPSTRISISSQVKSSPPTSIEYTVSLLPDGYKHYAAWNGSTNWVSSACGTAMVYRLAAQLPSGGSGTDFYYGYGKRVVYDSQYGGQTYEDRKFNTYIPAGRRDFGDVTTIICDLGDTFITLFEYARFFVTPNVSGHKELTERLYFACEGTVNTILRHDDPYSNNYYITNLAANINENAYVDTDTGIYFSELYEYNYAYSITSQDRKFFSKPLNFTQYDDQPTKVKYSDVKINTEDHDSWLSFRTNNFNEASSNYGEINRLVEFYDKVFCFQNNAVSLISINPRVTQQSEDGVTITLGAGSVIDKFNYLTTEVGCQDNSDVIKSFSAMYWLDKNKKKIYTYNGKIQSITDLKGMHSYLKNNVTEDSYFIGTYDIHNSEVVMTLYDDNPNSIFLMQSPTTTKSLVGDTTLLDYEFVIGNLYNFNGGWCRVTGINPGSNISLEWSHGDAIPHNTDIDMHPYMTERDNFTIAFNEKLQAFTSFYSFVPNLYISHNRDFFTTTNLRDLYQHNIGTNFNEFYGTAYPLQLKLISNYGSQAQGEYTNFEYFMTAKVDDVYLRNETLTNIHCKNEYQETTDVILYPMHLPNDTDRTKWVLDTSSTRIGTGWWSGMPLTPYEGLRIYENQLYRCINLAGHVGPPTVGADWSIAELANIRKTVEHWLGQMPRYDHRDPVYDSTYLTSDRLRSNWLETTFEYRSVLPGINIEEVELKISDITFLSNPMQF